METPRRLANEDLKTYEKTDWERLTDDHILEVYERYITKYRTLNPIVDLQWHKDQFMKDMWEAIKNHCERKV